MLPDELNPSALVGSALVAWSVEKAGSFDSVVEHSSALGLVGVNVGVKATLSAVGTVVGVDSTDDSDTPCYGVMGWSPIGTKVLLMSGMPSWGPMPGYAW